MSRYSGYCVGALWLSFGLSAHAAPSTLDWLAPAECPQLHDMRDKVERLLGQPLDADRPQSMRFRGNVQTDGNGEYEVTIAGEALDGTRERTLRHRDCQNASNAAAFIIALAIDPTLTQRTRQGQQPGFAGVSPEAQQPTRSVVHRAQEERKPSPSESQARGLGTLQAGLELRTGLGTLPGVGLGVGFELGLLLPASIRIVAGATRWRTTRTDVPERAGAFVKFDAWSLGLRSCWLTRTRDRWAIGACAGLDGSRMGGTGFNLDASRRATDWWWGVLGGGRAEYRLAARSRVHLMLVVEGGKAIDRPRFGLEDGTLVYQPAPWFVQSNLGIFVLF